MRRRMAPFDSIAISAPAFASTLLTTRNSARPNQKRRSLRQLKAKKGRTEMKSLFALLILSCACVTVIAQQAAPSPSLPSAARTAYRHRWPKRPQSAPIVTRGAAKKEPNPDFFVGEARVDVTKDET